MGRSESQKQHKDGLFGCVRGGKKAEKPQNDNRKKKNPYIYIASHSKMMKIAYVNVKTGRKWLEKEMSICKKVLLLFKKIFSRKQRMNDCRFKEKKHAMK